MKENHHCQIIIFMALFAASMMLTGCGEEEDPNNPPNINLFTPANSSVYFLDDELVVELNAWDADGEVSTIEVFLDETLVMDMDPGAHESSKPLSGYSTGDYVIKIVVTDDRGGQTSESLNVSINPARSTFTDPRDGNVYRYVQIGEQIWMADNLAYLPEVYLPEQTSETEPRYYVFNYSGQDVQEAKGTEAYKQRGVNYNYHSALIAAPDGWHLPSHEEWLELEEYVASQHEECLCELNESDPYGPDTYLLTQNWSSMAPYLAHTSGWPPGSNGTNSYGLSLCPSEGLSSEGNWLLGSSNSDFGLWWTSSELAADNEIWMRRLSSGVDGFVGEQMPRSTGLAIRCIKDD
jgi:uncharacterized protein (TIGR02145 family)